MRPIKKIPVGNAMAVLFENGDVSYAGEIFPAGIGCNASVLRALGVTK